MPPNQPATATVGAPEREDGLQETGEQIVARDLAPSGVFLLLWVAPLKKEESTVETFCPHCPAGTSPFPDGCAHTVAVSNEITYHFTPDFRIADLVELWGARTPSVWCAA